MKSTFYSTYGYYGRENFNELAKRIGIIGKRAERIIDQFLIKKKQLETFVQRSFLTKETKEKFLVKIEDKLNRIQPIGINNIYTIYNYNIVCSPIMH